MICEERVKLNLQAATNDFTQISLMYMYYLSNIQKLF